jgi:hypothetical protein
MRWRAPGGDIVVSGLNTGSAMATTAIGTLLPLLRDAGWRPALWASSGRSSW